MREDFDDPAATGELYFEPSVSATGSEPVNNSRRAARRTTGLRHKLATGAVLATALVAMGGAYTLFAASSTASDSSTATVDAAAGHQLYSTSCITCHGANLEGVKGRGVSLIGVGAAATYFQVTTGRMPATGQGPEQDRKDPRFNDQQAQQLAAYVQSVGGGTDMPYSTVDGFNPANQSPESIAQGGQLFRLNCASCHGTTFAGAPLSAGKNAPSLKDATNNQIYAAMLSGPESMPIFSDNQLSSAQKLEIVSYIHTLRTSQDPGGHGIDRIGPVSEAIVAWVGGIGFLMIIILWIGAKSE